MASGKRITQIPNTPLLRAGDLPRPGTQASAELVRPLVRRFEDDATALTAHQYLALFCEPALLWQSDRLTAAILEEFRANRFHVDSLDARLYSVKLPSPHPSGLRRTVARDARGPELQAADPRAYGFLCQRHLFAPLGAVKLADITREHAWALLAEKVQGGMKRTTALKIVALLREIMNHAVENRLIPFDPATRLARFYRGRTE